MGTTADKVRRLAETKADIKRALETMGRTPGYVFSTYGDEIRAIRTEETINSRTVMQVEASNQIKVGDTVYYLKNSGPIHADAEGTLFSTDMKVATFSSNGKLLLLGGRSCAKVYAVSGVKTSYLGDIDADADGAKYSYIYDMALSPDGRTLVVLSTATGYAKIYSVDGQTITYVRDIYADAAGTALNAYANDAKFSPDGKLLVLVGDFTGYAKVYSVNGAEITYVSDIVPGQSVGSLYHAKRSTFSPDGKLLVLTGSFSTRAAAYSVNGTTVTFAQVIYDGVNSFLVGTCESSLFSPDGKTMILMGMFTGCAKVYSVYGGAITYVRDIPADANGTKFSGDVYGGVFSPDGRTLVLYGYFGGWAKIYTVSGSIVTYSCQLMAHTGEPLNNRAFRAALSPDGHLLVLTGEFTDGAAFYRMEDTANGGTLRPVYGAEAGAAADGMVQLKALGTKVGFAKEDIAPGDTGDVVMIAEIV